jgi:hypothetical protein
MTKPADPFRYFNSSPEVIRLVVCRQTNVDISPLARSSPKPT